MKSERRHDLQHNELLVWLAKISNAIKPHSNTILIGLILIMGAYGAAKIWSFRSGEATAKGWDSLYAAMNSGEISSLDGVAEGNSGNEVGDWAGVVGADLRLASGCDQLFGNKIEAGQELQKAMEGYVAVLDVSENPSIQERATFGLARTYEAMAGTRQSQGEFKKAKEKYQEVVEGEGVYAESAKRRLEDLNRPATETFYDQFARHDPGAAFDPASVGLGDLPFRADSLSPGSVPRDFSDLLDSPGLSGDDGVKDDSMETGGQEEAAPTDSKEESDTPAGQPAPEQSEKSAAADTGETSELAPPALEAPVKTDTE